LNVSAKNISASKKRFSPSKACRFTFDFFRAAMTEPGEFIRHLYVHIPFCPKICPYCSFYKEASDRNKTRPFLEAVLAEFAPWAERLRPGTIFFGGGTPTALSPAQLDFLLSGLRELLDFSAMEEWTFEMNPATVSLEKARMLREFGVNRVSMGVQAWQPELLETLGRVHSAGQARRSFEILREAGFTNLNMDLIFGVPGQTLSQWEESLEKTVALEPEHISAYCLTYEEDTEFFRLRQAGTFTEDEDSDAEFFLLTRDRLAAAGYEAYEISNFSRPGQRCAHNLAYWHGEDYLGLGPSAFSTVGTRRWRNIRDTSIYTASTLEGKTATDFREDVDEETRRAEQIAFGLRTADGVPMDWLDAGKVSRILSAGLALEGSGSKLILTPAGRLLADEVAAELLAERLP
jgi:oxygen-independent coproporphyrinogen III oxidase